MTVRQALGFAVFCLLGGSRWLVDNAVPSTLSRLEQASLHYGVIGAVALLFVIPLRRPAKVGNVPWLRLAMAGLLLLGLPLLLNEAARGITAETRVALFALVPLLVVLAAVSHGQQGTGLQPGRALMMPALAGFSGALLLLPFEFPSSLASVFFFGVVVVAVVLTAAGSVWMHSLLQDCHLATGVLIVCASNGVVLGMASVMRGLVVPAARDLAWELLRCAVLDLPLLFLLVWLLQQVLPARLATRFLIVPLVSTIEGAILLRVPIGLRMGSGMVLMAVSAAVLLFRKESDGEEIVLHLGLK